MARPRRRIVEYQSPFRPKLRLQAADPLWTDWLICMRRLVMYNLQVRVTVRMSADFLNKSACPAAHIHHSRQRESLSVSGKNFESSRKWERPFRVTFFYNCRAVASVVPHLLTPSSWWRLCSAMLHWIEIILALTVALHAHATVFFSTPPGKITITVKWNINQIEKEKDGRLWRGRASAREEEIRDYLLFLN